MRRVPTLLAVAAIAALAGPSTAVAQPCAGDDFRPAADNIPQVAQATLCLINAERAAAGLAPLAEQAQLTKASADFSALMVAERFFAHVSPNGDHLTDRLTKAGYLGHPGSWTVGENIAWGESYLATAAETVRAWMDSPPHRKNILNADFREVGLGIALGTPSTPNPGATYTTDFGSRQIPPGAEDPPAAQAQTEVTVGNGAPVLEPARGGSRGADTRVSRSEQHRASVRRSLRRSRAACRRTHRRARAARRASKRVRCVGAWRAVKKSF